MPWNVPKTDWVPADGVADTDLNEIGENLEYIKDEHIDQTSGIHGAVSAPTASKMMIRDANGRCQVAAPNAGDDIVNLTKHNEHATSMSNPHGVTKAQVGLSAVTNNAQMPIAGGTFTGKAYAQNNTDYTIGQIRNIFVANYAPTTEGGNGDMWVQY